MIFNFFLVLSLIAEEIFALIHSGLFLRHHLLNNRDKPVATDPASARQWLAGHGSRHLRHALHGHGIARTGAGHSMGWAAGDPVDPHRRQRLGEGVADLLSTASSVQAAPRTRSSSCT